MSRTRNTTKDLTRSARAGEDAKRNINANTPDARDLTSVNRAAEDATENTRAAGNNP